MNTKVLQKCIDELNKEKYSKEYVLGMLETLIEMQDTKQSYPVATYVPNIPDQTIPDLVTPVITGFKDLIPKEEINDTTKNLESTYLRGGLGKI